MRVYFLLFTGLILFFPLFAQQGDSNPPAQGFNLESSDPRAIAIADQVMEAMGGRKAWDETRFIYWTFFGRRNLLWDKYTGDVRVENLRDSTVYLVNINNGTGKVSKAGRQLTEPDTIAKYVALGRSYWINDAYWLVMPFKLKDSGVTLKYLGEGQVNENQFADILQLTFERVGDTPENKYHVYVDKTSHLVVQWDYFQKFSDTQPTISTPWKSYARHGKIWLSGDRGERRQLTNIRVFDQVPQEAFHSFVPIDPGKW